MSAKRGTGLSIRSLLFAGYLCGLALLLLAWAVATAGTGALRANYAYTVHTTDALTDVVLQGSKLRDDEETGLRGYLLTGQRQFLQPYLAAQPLLATLRQQIMALSAAEPELRSVLLTRLRLADAWDLWARGVLAHPVAIPHPAPAIIAQQEHGKTLFDRYRAATAQLLVLLDRNRQDNFAAGLAQLSAVNRTFVVLFASATAMLTLLGWRATRAVTRPLDSLGRAAQAIGQGELARPVAVRGNREFTRLATNMDVMRRQLAAREEALRAREAELAASEGQLCAVYGTMACGVVVVNSDGTIAEANAAACGILGVPRDALVGRTLAETTGSSAREDGSALPPAERPSGRALTTGQPVRDVAFRLTRLDGAVRWLRADAVPLLDERGAVRQVVSSFVDATASREARAALHMVEERLRMVVDNAPILLSALDRDGVFTLAEGRGLAMRGHTSASIVGRSIFDLYAGVAPVQEGVRRALAGETVATTADLAGIAFETHYTPLRDANGAVTGVIGVSTDVTERLRAAEALRASEELLRTVITNAPLLIFALDRDGVFTLSEGQALAKLGLAPGEVVGLSVFEAYRAYPDVLGYVHRALAGETVSYTSDVGGGMWDNLLTPLRDEAGAVAGLIGVSVDVAERGAAEEALRTELGRQAAVVSIQQAVATAKAGPDALMALIAGCAQELTRAAGAVVELVEAEEVVYRAVSGTMEGYLGTRLPLVGTLSGLCVRTGEALRCDDAADDPRTDPATCRRLGIGSMVTVPLHGQGRVIGVLKVLSPSAHAFAEPDVQALQLVAGLLSAALGQAQAFAALHESEQLLQTVIGNAPIVLTSVDTDGIVTFSSGSSLGRIGWAPGSTIGLPIADVLADTPQELEHVRRALAGEATTAVVPLDGLVFEARYAPLHDGGRVVGAIVVSTDVTERAAAEAAHRRSEDRYRQLVEMAQEGIWEMDAKGRTTRVNRKMAEMLGYTPDEMVGRPLIAFMDEEGQATVAATMERYPDGHAEPREYSFVRRDRSTMWALLTTVGLHDPDGRRIGSFSMGADITSRKEDERRLAHRAHHDPLTGLPNRALLDDRLAQALILAQRDAIPLSLLLLDLDGFKRVNDTLGHEAGDLLLQEVARRLQATLRASDTVARLGGDEFAVLLPGTDEEGAVVTANKILAALTMPIRVGASVEVGASVGVALRLVGSGDSEQAAALLRRADAAMYRAKRTRCGYAVYTPGVDDTSDASPVLDAIAEVTAEPRR